MKVAAIIAEYNPFHQGHLYHMEQTKKITGADYLIVIMSGDYVQRGEPAIYNKYSRAQVALSTGADLVLELPSLFAVSSASEFASASVALLLQLGIVNDLCFGSECGSIEILNQMVALLSMETPDQQTLFKKYLKEGYSYPKARSLALEDLHPLSDFTQLMNYSNNILGIEYLMAIKKQSGIIKPATILRKGHAYHDQQVDHQFISATAVRKLIESGQNIAALTNKIPAATWHLLKSEKPIFLNDWSAILNYKLMELSESKENYQDYLDVSADLADKIRKTTLSFASFEERIQQLKSKNYTYTRLCRVLLHLVLGIKKEDLDRAKNMNYVPYARILGFRKSAAPLLKALKNNSSIPLISKVADANQILGNQAYEIFKQTIYHSHLYQSLYFTKYKIPLKNEYTSSCIIIQDDAHPHSFSIQKPTL